MSNRIVFALVLVLFAFGAVVVVSYPSNHDVAWLLHASRSVLGGADLYKDVIEPNPPLIVYLLIPVVGAASFLDVPAMTVFRLAVLVLTGASLAWSGALLRSTLPEPDRNGLDSSW